MSSARNLGLLNSCGEYIIFLDADDTLTKNILNEVNYVIKKNDNTDFIITDYNLVINGIKHECSNEIFKEDTFLESGKKAIEKIREQKSELPKSVWRCIIRWNVIRENKTLFNVKYTCAEDFDFVLQTMLNAENVCYSKIKLINYVASRENSATYNITFKNIISNLEVFAKYYYYFKDNSYEEDVYKYFANNYANSIYSIYGLKNKVEINNVIKHISDNIIILKDLKGTKYIFSKIIWKTFGYYRGSKILKVINKIRKK